MTRFRAAVCFGTSAFTALWLGACGNSADPGATNGGLSGSGGSGTSTAGTSSGGSGGSVSVAGSNAAGATVGGTSSAAGAGNGGDNATGGGGSSAGGTAGGSAGGSGGGGGGTLPEGPFACSMYLGAYLSMEWWNTGQFEGKGDAAKVNNDNWELKWHHHAHISEWRKADSPFWLNTGNPMDDAQGAPIQSPCTTNPEQPDRVVFLAIDWELITEADWVAGLTESVANIKTKIPSAKRVDIVELVKCPNNMMCNPTADYGPGANDSAPRQDCYVPPYVDTAIEKVIAAQPGYLAWGPKLQMAMCNPAHDGAHMTGDGNQQAAKDYAAYYLQHL
ncbi:MAG TPA: hypothetical protein VHB79_02800 [Polyangiaceae bacterium]|nr:hypothetical protein [Polyangiaceae bacterium]